MWWFICGFVSASLIACGMILWDKWKHRSPYKTIDGGMIDQYQKAMKDEVLPPVKVLKTQ